MRLDHMYHMVISNNISREEFMAALAAHPGGPAGAARVETCGAARWLFFGRDEVAQYQTWDGPTLSVWDLQQVRRDRLRRRAYRAECHAEWEPRHEAGKWAVMQALYEGLHVEYTMGQNGGYFRLPGTQSAVSARGVLSLHRGRKATVEDLYEWLKSHGIDLWWPCPWIPQKFQIVEPDEPPAQWGAAAIRRNPVEFDRVLAG